MFDLDLTTEYDSVMRMKIQFDLLIAQLPGV